MAYIYAVDFVYASTASFKKFYVRRLCRRLFFSLSVEVYNFESLQHSRCSNVDLEQKMNLKKQPLDIG